MNRFICRKPSKLIKLFCLYERNGFDDDKSILKIVTKITIFSVVPCLAGRKESDTFFVNDVVKHLSGDANFSTIIAEKVSWTLTCN